MMSTKVEKKFELENVLHRTKALLLRFESEEGAIYEYHECLLKAALQQHNLEALQLLLKFGENDKWRNLMKLESFKDFECTDIISFKTEMVSNIDILHKVKKLQQYLKNIDAEAFHQYNHCLFIAAIRDRKLKAMQLMLEFGADPNGEFSIKLLDLENMIHIKQLDFLSLTQLKCDYNYFLFPPLFYAICKNDQEMTELLLQYGADIRRRYWNLNALHFASCSHFYKMVNLLLDAGANVNEATSVPNNWTALHFAFFNGDEAIACLLIERGANINLVYQSDYTLLHLAAKKNMTTTAQLLLELGSDINAENYNNYTPLLVATEFGFYNALDNFRNYKASNKENFHNPNPKLHKHESSFEEFASAVIHRLFDIIFLLLKNGANVNHKNYLGETALHLVCALPIIDSSFSEYAERVKLSIAKVILEYGADINAKNVRGESPLHSAILAKNYQLIEILLKRNADVNIVENNGKSPLQYVIQSYKKELTYRISCTQFTWTNIWESSETAYNRSYLTKETEYQKIIKLMLDNGASLHLSHQGKETPFESFLYEMQDEQIITLMLQYDMNANVQPNFKDYISKLDWKKSSKFSKLLLRHLTRKGLEMHRETLEVNSMSTDQYKYYKQCLKEAKLMQLDLFYEQTSIYQLLCSDNKKLALLVQNKDLVNAFETSSCSKKYPIFAETLKKSMKRAKQSAELFNFGIKSLEIICNFQFTYLVYSKIIKQLSEKDLESLKLIYVEI